MKKKLVRLLSIPLLAFLLLGITACFDLATEQDVHDAKTALELVFASGESEENVTQNLTLPTSIGVGITVSWTSSNKAVISKAGVVTQQADDVEVELTAKLSKNNINIEKTFIVFVKGIIVYFDVLFDTNEGLPTPFTVEVVENNKVNAPDLPTRAGYYFEGWYKDDAFETAWNFTEDVVIENTTLYAKWDLIPTYTVSFTSNGGSMVPDIEGVEEFTKITTPVNPTREGYTFEGWFKDVDLEMPWNFAVDTVSEELTLYAKWAIIVLTVTFTGGPEVEVDYGDTIDAEDPLVDSPLPLFPDVVYTWKLSGVPFDFETPITHDMTLVGSWDIPEQLTITTQDQFHYMATVETTYSYVMANDLDFDTYTWVDTQSSFKGSFDGQMYTISNLTILATNGYGGIFARANGATIENLVIENIHVETTARAGALIGRVENNDVTISNIILVDSVVQGSDSNGVGGLIGLVSRKTTVNSVAIISTSVTAIGQKNVGGFVGRVDSAELIANDIFIHDVVVTSTASSGEDIAAGAFVGYVRDNVGSIVTASNVVVLNTVVSGRVGGAFIGYLRAPGTATLESAYFQVLFTDVVYGAGFVGRINDLPTGTISIESKDIHGNLTGVQSHARTQDLEVMDVPTNDTWWDLNVPSISSSLLWTVDDNGFAYLTLIGSFKKEVAVVTFDVDGGSVVLAQMILIGTNKALEPTAPEKFGFDFVGWSSVPESYVAFDFDEFIVEDTILYAIWLELNVFTVTFEVEGESDVDVLVVEGDTVGMPDDPIKEGKNFEGWFKDGDLDPFDFDTLITEDITLIAAFVDKVFYDVTFLDGISDTEDATLLYHFDFTLGHNTTYTTTPETPVNFTNLVDVQLFGVSLYRVAANTASVVGSSRALVISPRLGTGHTGYAYVELDFGASIINKLEFDTFFWSSTAEQYFTSIELLVWDDVEETWVLVLDLLDVLEGTLNIHSLSVDGFEGSMFRFYTTGGRDGGNDARVLLDNLKASEVEYLDEVDVVVEEGYLVSEPADPVKEGFIFLGWFVDIEDEDPFDFVTPITGNLTLTALYMIIEVEYTVSFVADGGTPEPEDQEVVDGLLATEPDGMTKDGYTFAGWFVDDGFTTEWDFDVDVVTDDMVLYAKWDEEVPSGTAITTTQEFYDATRNGTVGVEYYLANDLDFDGYVWNTVQATSFRGTFNGNGKTITNLSIGTGTETDRGGIFPTINGATILNLTITNSSVDVNARAGLIAGRVENNASSIENITIINSSVSGNGGEAVGIVVGQVSNTTTIQNIYISLSSSFNTLGKYTGLILGRADHAVNANDIYVYDSLAEATTTNTDTGVGGLVGYMNNANAVITASRVVIQDSELKGKIAGAIVGYYKLGSVSVTDALVDVDFTFASPTTGAIGRADLAAITLTNAYADLTGNVSGGSAVQFTEGYSIDTTSINVEWWETNIPSIHGSSLWTWHEASLFFILER